MRPDPEPEFLYCMLVVLNKSSVFSNKETRSTLVSGCSRDHSHPSLPSGRLAEAVQALTLALQAPTLALQALTLALQAPTLALQALTLALQALTLALQALTLALQAPTLL
jgi:hypothetical protein